MSVTRYSTDGHWPLRCRISSTRQLPSSLLTCISAAGRPMLSPPRPDDTSPVLLLDRDVSYTWLALSYFAASALDHLAQRRLASRSFEIHISNSNLSPRLHVPFHNGRNGCIRILRSLAGRCTGASPDVDISSPVGAATVPKTRTSTRK